MLTISPLKDEDIPAIIEIEKLSFNPFHTELFFKDKQRKFLVAREDEEVVGYIGVEKISDKNHIIKMAAHPDYRRMGIGKKLLENILNDHEIFFLVVRISNLAAQGLYEKYGFKITGIEKNYYYPDGEDACIMIRNGSDRTPFSRRAGRAFPCIRL
jgi:ribosomal-protein-alanine N-acetyltransferase